MPFNTITRFLLIYLRIQILIKLGVKRLVLPAAASVLNTWTTAFEFTPVTEVERSEFLCYSFLDFQDTILCQKPLRKRPSPLPRRQLSIDASGRYTICLSFNDITTLGVSP